MKNLKLLPFICVGLILSAVTANAAFKSSSTGEGVAKVAPPAVCVGNPAANLPCVITDSSVSFGTVADLKLKVATGDATKADFKALNITIHPDVDLDDADTIAYLNAKTNTSISSSNLPNSKTPTDLKSIIDKATISNVTLWIIYKTASDSAGYPISGLTSFLLADAGISTTILSDTGTTIANLQSNITGSGLTSSLTATNVENWIADAAGFSGTTTYAQVQKATTNGWSVDNFKAASNKGYDTSAGDKTLYDEALGSTYTNDCIAEDASVSTCIELSKTSFVAAKTGSTLLALKKTKVTAGTLKLADLTALNLTLTALGANPDDWKLEYLMTQLATGEGITKSDWQTTISAFSASTAAKWKLGQIVAETLGHPTPDLTTALLEAAGMTSGAIVNVGATIAELRNNITTSDLTASSTPSEIDNWIVKAEGFASGTTYSEVITATDNGWTLANYKQAKTNGGWTNTAAQKTNFSDCQTSTIASTGGTGQCTIAASSWSAIDAAITASTDTNIDITAANVTDILSTTNTTANAYLNTSDLVHIGYLNQCISAQANPINALTTCAQEADLEKNVKTFQIGKIAAQNSGDYTTASVTTSLLETIGVPTNSTDVIGENYCGSDGTASCLTALKSELTSSNLTSASTSDDVSAWVNTTMRDLMITVANNATVPNPDTTLKVGCDTSFNLALPSQCGQSQWSCSKTSGPSDWVIDENNLVVPSSNTNVGEVSVNIKMSLNVYTPSHTRNILKVYDVAQAVSAAANGKKLYNNGLSENITTAQNACRTKGGRLATSSEFDDASPEEMRLFHYDTADPDIDFTSTCSLFTYKSECTSSPTCSVPNYSQDQVRKNSSGYTCEGLGANVTWYYVCADLPTC